MYFYYAPRTCAVASHIALEEAGADYELRRLDFTKTEQRSAEYLRVNPKGRVPALVTERGILTETPAILAYIAQSYPEKQLAPLNDPWAFAQMQAFNAYLCATVHVCHAHKFRGTRWVDASETAAIEAMKRKVPETMAECFQLIEDELFPGPWVLGNEYSVADIYLFTLSTWLAVDDVDIQRFPKVADLHQRMLQKDSVQKVLAMN